MSKSFFTPLLGIFMIILALTGCNMPTESTPTEVIPPDAIFTAAAETIAAQLSPTAPISELEQPVATTQVPIVESSPTPEPTATSTPTETPTETPTPTGASTPTEIPQVIYFDDFSDTDSWWANDEDEDFGSKYTADGYHIYNNIKWGAIWSYRNQTYANVGLEVDGTRLEGPGDSYFGVVCNFSNEGDNYYALVLGDNGFYGLLLHENGESEFLESGLDEAGVINRGQGKTNRIRGVCNGGHFLIYANGELLLDTWDDSLEEGIVGLVVGNKGADGRAEFRFNDFAITYP
jgi:hypothetical protein